MSGPVGVLDYEVSNLRSATKALERLGANVRVVRAPEEAEGASALVLPGVGHFGEAIRRLRGRGLDGAVHEAVRAGVPVLGICVGLQLLFEESEESPGVLGLGILPGRVRLLRTERKLPHFGWAQVAWAEGAPLAPDDPDPAASTFYFVHSFACEPNDPALVLATADHGVRFCAAAGHAAVMGVQFHTEKSSAAGLALLERWLASVAAPAAVDVPLS